LDGKTRTGVDVSDYAGDDRRREAEAELGVGSIRGKSPIQGLGKPKGERDSAMAALSSKLPLRIASVALTFRNLRFSLRPLIDRKRSTNFDSFPEGAVRLSAYIAFVICAWLNQFSFASSFRFG